MSLVAGIDFGTQSVRVSIFDSDQGKLGSGSAAYPLHRHKDDPDHAAQSHADHMTALIAATRQAIAASGVDGRSLEALAIDTTGSTIVPVGEGLVPLDDYYLWCDHRAWREAEQITRAAEEAGLEAIRWCGGSYSCEWGFAKLLHWLRTHPEQAPRLVTALEHCDLATAVLCGITDPLQVPRSVCAMGHKWMWNESLGGLPSHEFLAGVDPALGTVRERLTGRYARSDQIAGRLGAEWAERLGLRPGIPIPVGALDAHWDAIGAGVRLGDVVNVIGTSTCVMAITERSDLIPGVCGVVPGSIHPSYTGIEAGLSAAGDIFDAIARRAGTTLAELSAAIAGYRAGQTGLLRLAWDNGDRSVLANPHLGGVTLGWNLAHTAADELFAAMESLALHTRIILERMAEYGVPVRRIINAGGISRRSGVINQVYANVLDMPVLVPESDTTSLGSAIFAFLAAGTFATVEEAQSALCPPYVRVDPDPPSVARCAELYRHFRTVYEALGREDAEPAALGGVLPALRRIASAATQQTGSAPSGPADSPRV